MKKILSLISLAVLVIGLMGSCKKSEPTYTVTFDANGHGAAPASIMGITSGSTIAKPDDPVAKGFIFVGWFREADCVNAWNFENDKVTSDITLFAGWDKAVTIADILPEDFPIASQEGPDQPDNAWLSIEAGQRCYLAADGSKLVFYNASGSPETKFSIGTDEVVSKKADAYVCMVGTTVTITFTMAEDILSTIQFEDTASTTWNGIYEQSACIAAGTMITMGDGGQKAVENLEVGDVIRTFDHKTGMMSSSTVCLILESKHASNVFTLTFEEGVKVTVIEEHGFYDKEEMKYAFVNPRNARSYIGHHFYDADSNRWLELKSYEIVSERTDAYAVVSSRHINHMSNGMLSMCDGSVKILANLFEYDSDMKYDAVKKAADIEAFGLTPMEKVLEFEGFTEADYYDYNLQYLDIAVGKGLISWEWIQALSDYCVANGI